MLLGEHEKFHQMGPKDVGIDAEKKSAMSIDILRTTNHTGEQIHIQIPVYGTETREEVLNRMNFVFSLIQDRLESENKAIQWRNERENTIRRATEASRRNQQRLEKSLKKLNADRRKERWTDEVFMQKRTALMEEFKQVDGVNQARINHAAEELNTLKEIPYTGPGEDEAFANLPEPEESEETEEETAQH